MFRKIRNSKRELPRVEAERILTEGKSGVLAVAGDEGYPYAVPMSYAYQNGNLYFHSALSGHKLDAIAREEKVSFCVVAQDSVVPEKFTTRYQSAIAFGRACIVTDSEEKRQALMALVEKHRKRSALSGSGFQPDRRSKSDHGTLDGEIQRLTRERRSLRFIPACAKSTPRLRHKF